jgi:hypothetical protein
MGNDTPTDTLKTGVDTPFDTLKKWPMCANGAEPSRHGRGRKVIDLQWVAEVC